MATSEHTGLKPGFTPFVSTMYLFAAILATIVFVLLYWKNDVLAGFGALWPYIDRALFFM